MVDCVQYNVQTVPIKGSNQRWIVARELTFFSDQYTEVDGTAVRVVLFFATFFFGHFFLKKVKGFQDFLYQGLSDVVELSCQGISDQP